MDASRRGDRTVGGRHFSALAGFALAGPMIYAIGTLGAALLDRESPVGVVAFDPAVAQHAAPLRALVATVMALGAVLLLVVAPWLLGSLAFGQGVDRRLVPGAWSLALNSAALIGVCLLLRNTVGIGRASFLVAWLLWTGLLWLIVRRPGAGQYQEPWRKWGLGTSIGLVAVGLGVVLFRREQFVQCFNGDGTEMFELARSLRLHLLPYWEIETVGQMGTVIGMPVLINSYWTFALQVLLGEGELATRLPFWIWSWGILCVSLSMVQADKEKGVGNFLPERPEGCCAQKVPDPFSSVWIPAVPLALGVFLWSIWYTFYTGYYPYMTDLANLGVPDVLFTLLVLLALECLRRGDAAGWVASMSLASLVHYAGPVMAVLTVAAALVWQPIPRPRMVRAAAAYGIIMAGVVLFYLGWGWMDGSLGGWASTLRMEYFEEYFARVPAVDRGRDGALFLGMFLLGCGGIPALGLLRALLPGGLQSVSEGSVSEGDDTPCRRGWERTAACLVLGYLVIILGAGYKNLHYLGPILPITLVLWLRGEAGSNRPARSRMAWSALASLSLAVCICLCWPSTRHVFTLNRRLGAATTFATDSLEEAYRWGRISSELYDRGDLGWQIVPYTWVGYSELAAEPIAPRPLVVTDGARPSSDYTLVLESADGVKLYRNDAEQTRWIAGEPLTGLDRWPRVFKPVAISPRVRHSPEP